MIFALSAAMAVMMYMEAPRLVFEAQRQKEDQLIARGEQYQRAIQLFFRKHKKYPQSLEEVEKFQDVRFLRKKFKDPLTGKGEWRVVKVDASGQFIDSLVHKRKDPAAGDKEKLAAHINAIPSANLEGLPGQEDQNAATRQRASDRPAAIAGSQPGGVPGLYDPSQPQGAGTGLDPRAQQQPGVPGQPGVPAQQTPQYPGQPAFPGLPMYPGQTAYSQGTASQPQAYLGQPTPFYPGQVPLPFQLPGQGPGGSTGQTQYPGQPLFPGQPAFQVPIPGQNPGGIRGGFNPQIPFPGGTPANSQSGGASGGAAIPPGSSAAQMIQQMLTTPRTTSLGTPGTGVAGTGGIAGIASKAEGSGIKLYNERSKYKEWEFLYEPQKDKSAQIAGGAAGGNQLPGSQPGSDLNSQPGTTQRSPFGAGPIGSNPGTFGQPAGPNR
jgi:hypothetical protein